MGVKTTVRRSKSKPMRTPTACPSCGGRGLKEFYDVRNVPVHSCLLMSSQEEALAFPTGNVVLGFCPSCGFISNVAFDGSVQNYSPAYEDQQCFSETFSVFHHDLTNRLVKKYDLRNKDIVEVGCGKGDFLALLCELGNNRGVGIDPSVIPGRLQSPAADRITFIQEHYSERHARYQGDFVCCRHTLEHIPNTREFAQTMRRAIGNRLNTVIFIEVPDTIRVLREQAFWDIYYEHCSYFTLGSLARLFRSCEFEVTDLYLAFDDQYLLLEGCPANGATASRLAQEDDLEQTARDVVLFVKRSRAKLESWKHRLEEIQCDRRRAVIWGSGSKCVAFLSTLCVRDEIEYVVDINPHRHGKFLAGSGKKIWPPESLREYKPDTVIVMNPIYAEEIRRDLHRMGLSPELVTL